MPPADLTQLRAEASARLRGPSTDRQFASYLMYPKVFTRLCRSTAVVSAMWRSCPHRCFSMACEPGQEISIELERGKTLIVRYVTQSEPHEDGTRTVFFELNGQPRSVRVTTAARPQTPPQRKIEPGNPRHVGAPMPGTVATVALRSADKVEARRCRGDDRGHEDAGRGARRDRRRGRRSAGAAPARRWMPRICWWCCARTGRIECDQALSAGVYSAAGRRIGAMADAVEGKNGA